MKVALVASSYLPHPGGLERHVDELARGLARRGAHVEVLTQDSTRRLPRVAMANGVVVRRFLASLGNARTAVAPGLWEHLRRTAAWFDLTHVHTTHAPLALAVMRAGPRRLVFTPHAPVQRLVRWPYIRATRAVIDHAVQTICTSRVESDLLSGRFPWAEDRISGLPSGVDVATIQAAEAIAQSGVVALTVGRLERHKRVDRAIAAMASVSPGIRLVIVGEGPIRRKLAAHASDLRVSPRVEFAGPVPDAELYRWLRTARVVVSLAEQGASVVGIIEALSAGAPVVASDIPIHREAASHVDGAAVTFVSPEGSPLEVADGISEALEIGGSSPAPMTVPSWDTLVDGTLALYERSVLGSRQAAVTVRG